MPFALMDRCPTTLKPPFETAAPQHLDASYNLARWLLRDPHAAQDAVQDAYLRAMKYYASFRGDDIRPWLLSIVRNTCYTVLKQRSQRDGHVEFDEERDTEYADTLDDLGFGNPESALSKKQRKHRVNEAIQALPTTFREVLILREIEYLSYDEIATIADIPLGTVMSRLSRARTMLRTKLRDQIEKGIS